MRDVCRCPRGAHAYARPMAPAAATASSVKRGILDFMRPPVWNGRVIDFACDAKIHRRERSVNRANHVARVGETLTTVERWKRERWNSGTAAWRNGGIGRWMCPGLSRYNCDSGRDGGPNLTPT